MEDDLMRLFGSERIMGIMDRLGWEEDQPIDHPQISKAIENAQKRVETRHFEIRRQVLEYDDVMNKQREVIYAQRRAVLLNENISEQISSIMGEVLNRLVQRHADEKINREEWDLEAIRRQYAEDVGQPCPLSPEELAELGPQGMGPALYEQARRVYERRMANYGPELQRHIEKLVLLQITDQKWMAHLSNMDDLREGIGLRAYGQRDPLIEYRLEAYQMFEDMVHAIQEDCMSMLFKVRLVGAEKAQPKDRLAEAQTNQGEEVQRTPRQVGQKVGRNDPCPCGSGLKYKKCHGRSSNA